MIVGFPPKLVARLHAAAGRFFQLFPPDMGYRCGVSASAEGPAARGCRQTS
jgi:hypothetical protein